MGAPTLTATEAEFDAYAAEYQRALDMGLRLSGEGADYFIRGRLLALGERVRALEERPRAVLDFGCGTGGSTALLKDLLHAERAIGVDVSSRALAVARRDNTRGDVEFHQTTVPIANQADCAYCNGVFHHIAPERRAEALAYVSAALRPNGLFALCENNPWNLGTRLVMRSIPFDRGAMPLSHRMARRLLEAGGFEVLGTDFLFVFPRALQALRPLERRLQPLPLGAQYMILTRKRSAAEPVKTLCPS
jgi:SAM-dependent methyltransferase